MARTCAKWMGPLLLASAVLLACTETIPNRSAFPDLQHDAGLSDTGLQADADVPTATDASATDAAADAGTTIAWPPAWWAGARLTSRDGRNCRVGLGKKAACWGRQFVTNPRYAGDPGHEDPYVLATAVEKVASPDGAATAGIAGIAVGAGKSCGCYLGDDHKVRCWCKGGQTAVNLCGTASPCSASAVVVPGVGDAVQVAMANHVCAVRSTGELVCWGANDHGQLGNGTKDANPVPGVVQGLQGVSRVALGEATTCAIAGGSVRCWGASPTGLLGIASDADQLLPGTVPGVPAAVDVAVGAMHACAVTTTGEVWCWGYNGQSASGAVANTYQVPPTRVALAEPAVQVAAGSGSSCALTIGRRVACWGGNDKGQLGDGALFDRANAGWVTGATGGETLTDIVAIAATGAHVCALRSDDSVYCWGDNSNGIATGSSPDIAVPALVYGVSGVVQVAPGAGTTCARTSAGKVRCWGANNALQFGTLTADHIAQVPVEVPLPGAATALAVGDTQACAVTVDGKTWCWGSGSMISAPMAKLGPALDVSVTTNAQCARLSTGTAACWGSNYTGVLGNDSLVGSSAPVQVAMASVQAISIGAAACAIDGAGKVWCWGDNSIGAVGQSADAPGCVQGACPKPTPLPVDPTWTSAAFTGVSCAADNGCCAVTSSGTGLCWGPAGWGASPTVGYSKPGVIADLAPLGSFRSIAVGGAHACGLTTAGKILCWGDNSHGQLAQGGVAAPAESTSAIEIKGIYAPTAIACGSDHTCAIDKDGHVWCWGRNDTGQVGGTGAVLRMPSGVTIP